MIVPTRSRPASIPRLVRAWTDTGAFDDAQLLLAPDYDDPAFPQYQEAAIAPGMPAGVVMTVARTWQPMVRKLDAVAREVAAGEVFAIGFAGDDHVPRTVGWTGACLAALREMGSGIVYGRDGYQDENLPTWWVMTADVVRALSRMVPAPVEHLYCDNAVKDLGMRADCLRYLPDVLIEHLNPYADGKGEMDAQYRRVNSKQQFGRDEGVYVRWKRHQLPEQAARVRALKSPQDC